MARIISIVNQKGGTGKSACTANLAVGLAQKNMKVLIVDADPQSDVSAGFGYRDCDESNETLTALMDTVMKDYRSLSESDGGGAERCHLKKEQLPFPYSRLMHCLEQTKRQPMELVR